MKKLFITLVMLLAFNQISNAQGQTCLPTDPNYCNPSCSSIICDIDNELECPLNFVWGYQGGPCSDPKVSAGTVTPSPSAYTPALPWVGPCMSFCDQPCECPTMFRVIDPNPSSTTYNQPVDPWGGAIFSCCWSGTYNNIFQCWDSSKGRYRRVDVDVTVVNGCITYRFYYDPLDL